MVGSLSKRQNEAQRLETAPKRRQGEARCATLHCPVPLGCWDAGTLGFCDRQPVTLGHGQILRTESSMTVCRSYPHLTSCPGHTFTIALFIISANFSSLLFFSTYVTITIHSIEALQSYLFFPIPITSATKYINPNQNGFLSARLRFNHHRHERQPEGRRRAPG